jgi:hypothetical protein
MGYLLAALLGGFFFFNSQATPERAARVMEKTLQQRFPGAQVQAQVEGKRGRNVLKGRFQRVHIAMSDFQMGGASIGIQAVPEAKSRGEVGRFELALRNFAFPVAGSLVQVGALDMNFDSVVYDWNALKKESMLKIVSAGPAAARVSLPAQSLEPVLRSKFKDVQNLKLTLLPNNRLRLTGTRLAPIFNTSIGLTFTGQIEIRNGREIWVTRPNVQMGGVPVAAPLANAFLGGLNPVYAFDAEGKSPLRIQVTSLKTENNTAELNANLVFVPVAKTR